MADFPHILDELLGAQEIQVDGVPVKRRAKLNFTGVTVQDDADEERTDIEVPGASGSAGTGKLIAALRAQIDSLTADTIVHLKGRSTAGDGGEGAFVIVDSGTFTDDDGTVLTPGGFGSSHSKAARRIYTGPLSPAWFGAVGDGSTNDTIALQRCFALAKEVRIDKPHLISGAITLVSGNSISGDGKFGKLKMSTAVRQNFFTGTGVTGIRISDIELDGQAIGSPTFLGGDKGIHLVSSENVEIRNCYIHDTLQAGISFYGGTNLCADGNSIVDTGRTSAGTDNHGIMIVLEYHDVRIVNNFVSGAARKGIASGSFTFAGENLLVANNTVQDCGLGGIYLGGDPARAAVNTVISGNTVQRCYTNILVLELEGVSIVGNTSREATGDCGLNLHNSTHGVVSGNDFSNNAAHGILFNGVNPITDFAVTGNICKNNNQTNASYTGIYLVGTSDSTFTGNVCTADVSPILQTGNGPAVTLTGTPTSPGVDLLIKITTGGALGVGKFDWSKDNGATWEETAVTLASTHVLTGTGMTANFAAGTYVLNTEYAATTPKQNVGIQEDAATCSRNLIADNICTGNVGFQDYPYFTTLVNGANGSVRVPGFQHTIISGPTGAFSIAGITEGFPNRELTIFNGTGQAMTLLNASGSAPAEERFITQTGFDLVLPEGNSIVTLKYDETTLRWVVTSRSEPTLQPSYAVVTDANRSLASLAYSTAASANTLVERDGSGNVNASTLNASAVNVSSLTASELVTTDGSKNLSSAATITLAQLPAASAKGEVLISIDGSTWIRLGPAAGSNLTDADQTIDVSGGAYWYLLPASTLSADRTKTLGTTGAVAGAILTIVSEDATAHQLIVVNGGPAAGTLYTRPNSTRVQASFRFDGSDWTFVGFQYLGGD